MMMALAGLHYKRTTERYGADAHPGSEREPARPVQIAAGMRAFGCDGGEVGRVQNTMGVSGFRMIDDRGRVLALTNDAVGIASCDFVLLKNTSRELRELFQHFPARR